MAEKVLIVVTNIFDDDESTVNILTDNTVKKGIPWSDMGEELKDLTESINDKIDLFLADQFGSELRYEDICNSIGKEYIALESLWTVQEAYQKIIDAGILSNVKLHTQNDKVVGDGEIILHCFQNENSFSEPCKSKKDFVNVVPNKILDKEKTLEETSTNNKVDEAPTSLSALLKNIYE